MKNQKGFTHIEIALAAVVVLIILLAGWSTYKHQSSINSLEKRSAKPTAIVSESKGADEQVTPSQKSKPSKSSTQTSAPKTEDDKILLAAGCKSAGTQCEIKDKTSSLAWVIYDDDHSSSNYFLSKDDDSWSVIYSGNGDVPYTVKNTYSIPESWLGPQIDQAQ